MPSTYSTNLKIELMATGENSGTWGTVTNTNLGTALEQAIVGYGNPDFVTDANLTITLSDSNSLQAARALVLNVTSTASLTVTRELIVPTIQKQYIVQNNTSGSQSITVKTSAGTGVTIPNGKKMHVYVNGTDVVQMDDFALIFNVDNLTLDGNTLSSTNTNGNIVLAPNGTGDVQLDADTVRVGDSNVNVTITSNGTADLILNTNAGTNSGSITIQDGVDGNIVIAPNGNGQVQISNAALDLTTIEVTNIKAKDGTASMTLADTTGNVTFSKATVIETTDNTNAALRVTQLGTGNAILVEDSANPDSTPFVVTAAGDVGVGASSPGYALDVQKSVANGVVANFQSTSTSAVNTGVAFRSSASNAANRNWALLANSSAFGDFVIRTSTTNGGDPVSGTDRLMIDPSGNLGLGGVTPVSALGFGQAASATGITFQSTSTTFNSGKAAVIKASISGSGNGALIFETYEGGSGGGERMRLTNTGTLNIVGAGTAGSTQAISFNGSTPVDTLVTDSSGRVGVGTSSPGAKLDIVTSSTIAGVRVNNATAGKSAMVIQNNGSTVGVIGLTGYWNGNSETNFGLYAETGSDIRFSTNGVAAPKAIIDTFGNLGLGVTPSAKLEIYSTNNAFNALQVRYNGSNDAMGFGIGNSNGFPYLGYNTKSQASVDAPVYERSNPAAQLRMDNGSFKFNIAPSGTANTTTITNGVSYTIITSGNQTDFGAANNNVGTSFTATSSGTLSSGTVSQNISFTQAMTLDASGRLLVGLTADTAAGGYFGIIQAQGSYPAIVLKGTETSAKTWQIGENAGSLAFYNTTDGERARITSGGNLLVGTDNSAENAGLGMKVLNTGGTVALVSSASDSSQQGFEMYSTTAAAYRLYINYAGTINATSTTISAISDQRLKENIQDLDVGLDKIMALKPRKFDWKTGKGKDIKGDRGWIAQEFEQVFPDLIDEWRDPAPEGEEPYKSVRADLIPVLVKAIQEQQAMINELKAEVAALKGA